MKVSIAKTKVCPFTLGTPMQEIKDNNGEPLFVGGEKNCLCGDCMAWEKSEELIKNQEYDGWVKLRSQYIKDYAITGEFKTYEAEKMMTDNGIEQQMKMIVVEEETGHCKRLTNDR